MVTATRVGTIEIKVNEQAVNLPDVPGRDEATGAEIKEAAIAQGVNIQSDFPLFEIKGQRLEPVGDAQTVHVHHGQRFTAVAPDDNSAA
jgi:hypothetical protein